MTKPDSARAAARHVIGIAGPVGGGKSTLVRELSTRLADSACIHFDDYEQLTAQPIEKIKQWMLSGAATDGLPVAGLAQDLLSLKAGLPLVHPAARESCGSGKYILFETQFGRRHAASGVHIDFLVWIDTPLDIALARKLRQLADESVAQTEQHAAFAGWLRVYLDNYLDVVGDLLRVQRETVGADADLVVDGTADRASVARWVEHEVLRRFE